MGNDCSDGKKTIKDESEINKVLSELKSHETGWETEFIMAITRGFFTFPGGDDSALFRFKNTKNYLVIWFGPGWMGAKMFKKGKPVRYFKKVSIEQKRGLLTALSMTQRLKQQETYNKTIKTEN